MYDYGRGGIINMPSINSMSGNLPIQPIINSSPIAAKPKRPLSFFCINCYEVHTFNSDDEAYYKNGYWVCKQSEDKKYRVNRIV